MAKKEDLLKASEKRRSSRLITGLCALRLGRLPRVELSTRIAEFALAFKKHKTRFHREIRVSAPLPILAKSINPLARVFAARSFLLTRSVRGWHLHVQLSARVTKLAVALHKLQASTPRQSRVSARIAVAASSVDSHAGVILPHPSGLKIVGHVAKHL